MSENPQPPQQHSVQPTARTPNQITQRTVLRIIDRAKRSSLGLNDPSKTPEIGKYAQHNLQTLGLLLVDCWEAKYDLCALMTAAMEEIAEHATATLASELSAATAALAEKERELEIKTGALERALSESRFDARDWASKVWLGKEALAAATAQLEEMTVRATSLALHLPPETLCGDIQRWRDEAKAQAVRFDAAERELRGRQGLNKIQQATAEEQHEENRKLWLQRNQLQRDLEATTAELGRLRKALEHYVHVVSEGGRMYARDALRAAAQPVATPAQGEGKITYDEFRKLWLAAGFKFECSSQLAASLIKAAHGDHSDFDEIERLLSVTDSKKRP